MTVDIRRVRLAVAAVVIGAGLGAMAYVATNPRNAAVGILVFSITALMAITVPTDAGIRYSLSLAAVAAAPLVLIDEAGQLVRYEAVIVLILGTVGAHLYVALIRADIRRIAIAFARHLVDGFVFLGVFVLLMRLTFGSSGFSADGAMTLSISAASAAWFFTDIALWSAAAAFRSRQRWSHHISVGLGSWPVAASVLATGVFFGIAGQFTQWWWALPVASMPYGFAHVAFHRTHETQRTYRQTIRALSRIPEVSALSPDGHGDRTAELALEIAEELGLSTAEVNDLEYAAQMHDIGRITLNQPSILRMGFTDEDIARWGAEMVAEVSYLKNVSELVLKQHEPYRRPGEQKDPHLPMGSKIIKAASAYDHATTELGFMPVEALEVLHRGAAYDYDPDVVGAIRAVLERSEIVS